MLFKRSYIIFLSKYLIFSFNCVPPQKSESVPEYGSGYLVERHFHVNLPNLNIQNFTLSILIPIPVYPASIESLIQIRFSFFFKTVLRVSYFTANICGNHSTFPVQMYAIKVSICGNFLGSQYDRR